MYRNIMRIFLAVLLLSAGGGLLPGSAGAVESMHQDCQAHARCPFCNMDRVQWAHSRMLVAYDDGTSVGTCSLRCLIVDLVNNLDKFPETISVGDYATKELINAETAYWVVGGDKPGVMSKRAKWAFADKAAAQAFIDAHGGELTDMNGAFKAAFIDLHEDTMMIRERRKAKRMKMQQKQQDFQ